MSVEKEIRKILGEATPAAARAKQDLVRSGLGHDKNAAATMAALKDPEAAMQNPAKRELLLKVMQDLLDVVVNDPSMVMKTKTALRKEEIEVMEEATLVTKDGPRTVRPGTTRTHTVIKKYKHESGETAHVVKQPNGFHGVIVTDKEHKNIVGSTQGNHSEKEAHTIAQHYAKNKTVGMKSGVWHHGSNETLVKEEVEEIEEKLIGGQKKLDKNKNGKLDAEDFKKLRNENLGQGEYDDPISRMRKKENEEKRKKQSMKEDGCEMDDDDEDEKKSKKGMKENYVSHAQRKAVWASRNDAKEAMKRKTKKEAVVEAVNPSEIAGNPKAYSTADVKKAYYHKKITSDDKKALERHLDQRHGNREWRKPVKEEVQIDEMNDYKVQVTHKNKDGKEDTMVHHLTGVKHRKAAGYIAIDRHRDMLKKKGIEPHAFSARIVESVTTNYDMIKGQSQNKAPTQKLATDYKLATKKTQKEDVQIDELKRSTLASYVSKAAGAYGRDKQLIGRESPDGLVKNARPEMKRAVKNRLTGINRAAEKLAKEEIQIDEMMSPAETYKKLAVKHLRDSMDKNATQKQRDYAKMMNKRALEASKMDNHTDALNHYRGMAKEEVQIDEAFPTVADARKRAKEAMKSKFEKKKISTGTVYQRKHKDKEKEEKDEKGVMDEAVKADKNVPFDPPYSKKQIAIPGKQGIGPSTARHLARLALAKQLKNKNNK